MPEVYVCLISYESKDSNNVHKAIDMVRRGGYPHRLLMLEDAQFREGIIKPLNYLLRSALVDPTCEYIVTMSNDHYCYIDGWLKMMVEKMKTEPNMGVLSGQQMNDHGEHGMYYQISQKDGVAYGTHAPYWETFEMNYNDVSRGFCLMRASMLRGIGLFDENFGVGSFENYDYYARLTRAGYVSRLWGKIVYEQCVHGNMDLPINSEGKPATTQDSFWDQPMGAKYFVEKWGVTVGQTPPGPPKFEGKIR